MKNSNEEKMIMERNKEREMTAQQKEIKNTMENKRKNNFKLSNHVNRADSIYNHSTTKEWL